MQTHRDSDFIARSPAEHRKLLDLEDKARRMVAEGASHITAGAPGEPDLGSWKHDNGMHVTQRPEDEHGILRISVGGGVEWADGDYCVFRGDRLACADLLRKALDAVSQRVPLPIASLRDAERRAAQLAREIKGRLPNGWGFALLLLSIGEGGHTTYMSSLEREDMIRALRECADKLDSGHGGVVSDGGDLREVR